MVSFDQNIVLSAATQERVDAIIQVFQALYHKLPDLSGSIDTAAATDLLKTLDRVLADTDPLLRQVDVLVQAVQALAVVVVLLLIVLVFAVAVAITLSYLVWKGSGVAGVHVRCNCGKKVREKVN
ncbi:hypothetical protein DE146DRAFT_630939 [Phaeosphaeria sp. MPI-PUGE-AT-0046c]|nr:hypothetical protein DE146DRAFT_630939 [Phaeosphaeria sp. MPI-PUGE-AT-0046c]